MDAQKQKTKNAAPQKNLRTMAEGMAQRLLSLLGLEKQNDILRNNYELGMQHLSEGHFSDAVLRFNIVTWLDPQYEQAWYYLGCSHMAAGHPKQARKAFARALQYQPDNAEIAYMLAIAGGKATPVNALPATMPLSLVQTHFDALAADYTRTQEEANYRGHTLLAAALAEQLVPGKLDYQVLELGVGTGLCGPLLRGIAGALVGVDISEPMLAEAAKVQDEQGRKTYNALIQRDAQAFLEETTETCDIILAANVVGYIGDLSRLFAGSARVLRPGGLLALTADKMDGDSFRLDTTAGRFRFSKPCLEALASQNGLRVITLKDAAAYPEEAMWICVFRK